jgi:hypothetical protein
MPPRKDLDVKGMKPIAGAPPTARLITISSTGAAMTTIPMRRTAPAGVPAATVKLEPGAKAATASAQRSSSASSTAGAQFWLLKLPNFVVEEFNKPENKGSIRSRACLSDVHTQTWLYCD